MTHAPRAEPRHNHDSDCAEPGHNHDSDCAEPRQRNEANGSESFNGASRNGAEFLGQARIGSAPPAIGNHKARATDPPSGQDPPHGWSSPHGIPPPIEHVDAEPDVYPDETTSPAELRDMPPGEPPF